MVDLAVAICVRVRRVSKRALLVVENESDNDYESDNERGVVALLMTLMA